METASQEQKQEIMELLLYSGPDKVERITTIFQGLGVDQAAQAAKKNYMERAAIHLDNIQVPDQNKIALKELAVYLLERDI